MELRGTRGFESDPYAGYVVDDSDLEYSECSADDSSGDETSFIAASRQMTRPATREDSEDEFERDMNDEADRLLEKVVNVGGKGPETSGSSDPVKHSGAAAVVDSGKVKVDDDSKFYDDIYFDSSDEEGGQASKKVVKLTNDELFYDPNMDDEDEKWVERQRQAYHNVRVSAVLSSANKTQPTTPTVTTPSYPSSDAVLNCPACMTTLCLDCQRHELYSNQFRAMFVLNCKLIKDEVLKYQPKIRRKRKKISQEDSVEHEVYRPVRCNVCDTEVAVYDSEEIYHFFNVIAGAP